MPVGTPFAAWPDGTARTGQRLMVLKGVVMHQAMIGQRSTFLPLILSGCRVGSKSARTAGRAVVGHTNMSNFSRIGPKVMYILVATSIERRKSSAVDLAPCLAKSTAYSVITLRCFLA